MKCTSCGETIGRLYEEVPLDLVEVRLAFNFFHNKTHRHRRNRGRITQVGLVPLSSGGKQRKLKDAHTSMSLSMVEKCVEENTDLLSPNWKDELFKLQSVVLNLNERLAVLEKKNVQP